MSTHIQDYQETVAKLQQATKELYSAQANYNALKANLDFIHADFEILLGKCVELLGPKHTQEAEEFIDLIKSQETSIAELSHAVNKALNHLNKEISDVNA